MGQAAQSAHRRKMGNQSVAGSSVGSSSDASVSGWTISGSASTASDSGATVSGSASTASDSGAAASGHGESSSSGSGGINSSSPTLSVCTSTPGFALVINDQYCPSP